MNLCRPTLVSKHAQMRWRERFPELDMQAEFAAAKRPGKNQRRKIREQLPRRSKQVRAFHGRYYLVSPHDVVFVVAPPEVIVTVFPLTGVRYG